MGFPTCLLIADVAVSVCPPAARRVLKQALDPSTASFTSTTAFTQCPKSQSPRDDVFSGGVSKCRPISRISAILSYPMFNVQNGEHSFRCALAPLSELSKTKLDESYVRRCGPASTKASVWSHHFFYLRFTNAFKITTLFTHVCSAFETFSVQSHGEVPTALNAV